MAESDLSESREWSGEWWLPDEPDKKFAGVLTYSPLEGLRLRLIAGAWEYQVFQPGPHGSQVYSGEVKSWPLVLGRGNGQAISLRDVGFVRSQGFSFGFGGADILVLRARTAVVGAWLEERDEQTFLGVQVTAENLTYFAQSLGGRMTGTHPEHAQNPGDEIGSVVIDRVLTQEVELGDLVARLHPHQSWPQAVHKRSRTDIQMSEAASISFSSGTAKSLDDWLPLVDSLGNLLTLATMSPCAVITIRVTIPPDPGYGENHPMHGVDRVLEILRRPLTVPAPDSAALDHRDFLLTMKDVPFAELMPRWFDARERFAAPIDLTAGQFYVTDGFIESKAITSVAAAESMHRSLASTPPMTNAEFKALKKAVVAAVPEERKQWIRERLGKNEPALRQRLSELALRPGQFMSQLVSDVDQWAKAATNVRNTLAHVGPSDKHSFGEIHAVAYVTQAVVVANLLSELGMTEDLLKSAFSSHQKLSRAVRLAKAQFGN